MSDFKFVLNREGVRSLLKNGGIESIAKEKARNIAGGADAGYTADSYVGKTRVNTMIYSDNPHVYFSNLKHDTLLKTMK